jgi:DNA-binding winged helix-turn-helix (wHTH) protein
MNQDRDDEPGYRFEGFHLLPRRRLLLRGADPVKLTQRAIKILIVLVERHGRIVSRDEILDLAFPGVFVEPGNVAVHITRLRKQLSPTAIATVPGLGYRFAVALYTDSA